MKNVIEQNSCTGCMSCYQICPKKAITIEKQEDGFDYPKIDEKKCIHCELCKKVCPVLSSIQENEETVEVYACKNKDDKIRMESSSGGLFTLIAEWILKQGGVVFGVEFNKKLEAVHSYVENVEDLEKYRGSKYLQSKIANSYQKVKKFLEQDRKVLFTGTPCQVEGLLAYLGKDYENLYTQDIICHGVPSPEVWRRYLEYKKKQKGEYPKRVYFRKKELLGWKDFQVCYEYKDKKEEIHHKEDIYMKLFLTNLDLRRSCYQCQFKKVNRKADITIADFWGIDKIDSRFNDNKGVSALLIHSKKGKDVLKAIKDRIERINANIEDIVKCNTPINKSVNYNERREEFFQDLPKEEFDFVIEKYL